MHTLTDLNTAGAAQALAMLDGIYEHSPWIAQTALQQRPFKSLPDLKHQLQLAVSGATELRQKELIIAHPELAGKAMVSNSLTVESTDEQSRAGLTQCSQVEFDQLHALNAQYNAKFGWPFVLAVRGARGSGLTRQQIIDTLNRRLGHAADTELAECLRNIHRIAEIRLNDRFDSEPTLGAELWDWHEALAVHSDPVFKERGELTVTYLTDAHRACAAAIAQFMKDAGFDSVHIDAVGNVVGRYESKYYYIDSNKPNEFGDQEAKNLKNTTKTAVLTGSHYDTVRNGGKYDGRLGILLPIMAVREWNRSGTRLSRALEVVAFSEEEGQRFKATFLGSGALTGHFNPAWLNATDADKTTLAQAMLHAGHPATMDAIMALKRNPADYAGFIEVHIEQGPVLNSLNLPLGVVTSINGSVRMLCAITGQASHAGTTPMGQRKDASCAVAELILFLERRATTDGDSVGTVGIMNIPSGSINVVPGRVNFSLDMRAPNDKQRDALVDDTLAELAAICARRGLSHIAEVTERAAAAPSDPTIQAKWANAVEALGLPVHCLPSGAGHDAMKLHTIMPQAMLFVRGENFGISHNPLESTTHNDMQLALDAFKHVVEHF